MKRYIITLLLALVVPLYGADTTSRTEKIYRIMPVGDSITEGGKTFSVYRYPLWEKLKSAGYHIEYVGSRTSNSPAGPLKHEGHGSKNAEFLV